MFKFFIEIAPLIAFFIGYKTGGIMNATLYILVTSIFTISISFLYEKKLNIVNLISTLILILFSGMTLLSGSSTFIKMKPTILYCVFSVIFYITSYNKKPAIKFIMRTIKLKDNESWLILNKRFMIFFIFMALMNEIVWRSMNEDIWVKFKVFGAIPITLIFFMIQIPFITKNKVS